MKKIFLIIITLLAFSSNTALAADIGDVNIGQMFANSGSSWVELMNLTRGVAWVIGVIVGGMALFKFKEVNEGKATITTAILYTFVSAVFISLPGSISTVTETLSLGKNTATELLSREPAGTAGVPGAAEAIVGVLLFIKLVGHIAFVRGFLILKDYGAGKNEHMGKAFVHIIGGAAAINIEATVAMFSATFFGGAFGI
ncbi:hypothetical protein NX493_004517 [Salmonella enterica]|nr:hypothetical protein [Salmonella enterica]